MKSLSVFREVLNKMVTETTLNGSLREGFRKFEAVIKASDEYIDLLEKRNRHLETRVIKLTNCIFVSRATGKPAEYPRADDEQTNGHIDRAGQACGGQHENLATGPASGDGL